MSTLQQRGGHGGIPLLFFWEIPTEINFVKEISAKAHGDGYMSFSSNFWLDFVTVWGVIRLNLEPTQKADCISRIFIPKIDFPDLSEILIAILDKIEYNTSVSGRSSVW